MTVKAYELLGSVSLDKEFLEAVADGKGTASPVLIEADADVIEELEEKASRNFDATVYIAYLEDGDEEKASEYMEANGKAINISDVFILGGAYDDDED